jgi:hypothetical protein
VRVSGYFNSGKWPQCVINILNVTFIPYLLSNQIASLSATWRYTATIKNAGADVEDNRDRILVIRGPEMGTGS